MDQQDPEQRIPELERQLAEAKATTVLRPGRWWLDMAALAQARLIALYCGAATVREHELAPTE